MEAECFLSHVSVKEDFFQRREERSSDNANPLRWKLLISCS